VVLWVALLGACAVLIFMIWRSATTYYG
jgi:hypothetical protein